jgi:hypothetical protein
MTLNFKYGFNYKNKVFGWLNKELYRLPDKERNYGLRKLNPIAIGGQTGYRICRDKKTIKQLSNITHSIDIKIEKIDHSDLP